MDPVAIFAALQWECQAVLRHLRDVARHRLGTVAAWHGHTAGQDVWLVKTGVGVQRAATAARLLSDRQRCALFVSTGCAGALAEDLGPGDLAVARAIVAPGGAQHDTDAVQRAHAFRVAERAALRATIATVLCSPEALRSARAKRAAARTHGAVAVEMEGAPIAARAAEVGVPFLSVRAILDTVDTELPEGLVDRDNGTIRSRALVSHLVTHWHSLPSLLPLLRMQAAARGSLARFFGAWFAETQHRPCRCATAC